MEAVILADASFIIAMLDADDRNHNLARAAFLALAPSILIPALALAEINYVFLRTNDNMAVVSAMQAIRKSPMQIIDLTDTDYDLALTILTKYHDTRIDFVDACVMAMTERLNTFKVLTFDRRDFSLYRTQSKRTLELLP
jgi:predicted nucleic acid-binding protein